jgi:hypothetical protein
MKDIDWDGWYALSEEMEAAADAVDALPEDREYTQAQLSVLEDLRGAGLKLARTAEAAIETFEKT